MMGQRAVSFSQPSKKILLCDETSVTALEVTYNYPFEKGAFVILVMQTLYLSMGMSVHFYPKDVEKSGPDETPVFRFRFKRIVCERPRVYQKMLGPRFRSG